MCTSKGRLMSHVDALSGNPLPHVMLIIEKEDSIIARIKKAQEEDVELTDLLTAIKDEKRTISRLKEVFYIKL